MPSVSILLPVRDAASSLPAALQSVRAQSWVDWELVAVDDGSTDGSGTVLEAAAAADSRVRVLRQGRLGLVPALQAGLRACRGDWVARFDADDLMPPQRLERQLAHARADPGLGLVSGRVVYGGSGKGFAAYVDWLNGLHGPEEIERARFVESPVAHPSVLFRRELAERHGGYREGDFPEDYELWLRWIEAGVRFGKTPHPVLVWNDPPGRLTRSDPRYAVDRFYEVKRRYLARWLKQRLDPGREVWLWGAGRVTRRRFLPLAEHGIEIAGFVEVDAKKCGHRRDGLDVRLPEAMPPREQAFIVAGVGKRGAREGIAAWLDARGWREGLDYLHAA